MDPPAGLVLEIVHSKSAGSRDNLEHWLFTKHLPARLTEASPVFSTMVFRTLGPDSNIKAEVSGESARCQKYLVIHVV